MVCLSYHDHAPGRHSGNHPSTGRDAGAVPRACALPASQPTSSLFVAMSKASHEVFSGPVAEGPHSQGRVDPGAGGKDGSAEDVQSRRIVDTQFGVHHRGGQVFAHTASAEVVAAADATKAWTTPRFLRTHGVKDIFGLLFHPVGKAPLVLSQVAGDAHERAALSVGSLTG